MWSVDRLLIGSLLTFAAYGAALFIRKRTKLSFFHPTLIAAPMIVAALPLLRLSIAEYQSTSSWLTFLAGPAIVAMGVPVFKNRALIRRDWPLLLGGVLVGGISGVASSVAVAMALHLGSDWVLTVAPKSVTGSVAVRISETMGGIPPLTLAITQLTGILGSMVGPVLLNLLRVRNRIARGVALGVSAHAGGTEKALQQGEVEGAASSLGMAINALMGAVCVPPVTQMLLIAADRLAALS